ncbi:MAG TPA: GNAT family N-acetyltransferase [Anaerolineales bacterium]|nr:GNAT family N-acetyltransferase [Anaerolineales bacterium]
MTASSLTESASRDGLQPVDFSRHLGGLADLIELCFADDMDAGGLSTIREMRFLNALGPVLRLLMPLGFSHALWNLGFVWMESGRVIGSVSAQRAAARSRAWLVANVAVHPDYRRRGIAFALMQATLELIRSRRGAEAILQVDDDNHGAIELYRRLGFAHMMTQTAWRRPARLETPPHQPAPMDIRLRARGEWADQLTLAALVRPHGLAWNRPLRPEDFAPGLWTRLDRFLAGQGEEHWVAEAGRKLVGSLTVRRNVGDGHQLILLVHPDCRGQLERPLLVRGLRRASPLWPVRVEHPSADEAADAVLRDLSFQPVRTLRWMRAEIR